MNIFEKLSRVFLLILSYIVLTSLVYILPAIAVAVIVWDKSVYLSCVTYPLYAVFVGILSAISTGVYMLELCEKEII
jgi:hypothetical protein